MDRFPTESDRATAFLAFDESEVLLSHTRPKATFQRVILTGNQHPNTRKQLALRV
jgi:hypothetical protein